MVFLGFLYFLSRKEIPPSYGQDLDYGTGFTSSVRAEPVPQFYGVRAPTIAVQKELFGGQVSLEYLGRRP